MARMMQFRLPVRGRSMAPWLAMTALGGLAACGEQHTEPVLVDPPPLVIAPACANPAPLNGTFNPRAPLLLVVFRSGVDAPLEATRLARRYDFTLTRLYQFAPGGFAALLTPQALAAIRCEETVRVVEYDGVATIS